MRKTFFNNDNFFKTLNGNFNSSDIHNTDNLCLKAWEILNEEEEVM